ncbi:migration and invasion enhancer 1 [Bombyx mandarina]|uniref:Migration and invasion enhancer 1 n=1 Tax=Bombyx mandarina TaxID=7092 RepID=A0A6J2J9G8_BOMMA|nr:migration and invasion enhancer 1 [Bombyx mandarina]XP_028025934.1 migration and invasion enhancer 1 [Bombyx mandarina]XP_028025935.1 migration and invasion enhancer 1 [Bombyx mandarina]
MTGNEEKSFIPKVHVEYCGACDYGGHCLALAQIIRNDTPSALVLCKRGRQGSFEVVVNDKLIYSKLKTMALPDYGEVAQVVHDVSKGQEPREIKGEQPINCAIS